MKIEYRYWIHGIKYAIKNRFLHKRIPFIAGLVLNNDCNLACVHCHLKDGNKSSLSYHDSLLAIDRLYRLGIRSIAITGGEPFMWHDGFYNVNHLIKAMHTRGILVTSIYTNGTFPINTLADNVFVSLDGTETSTNKLRGPIFKKVIENIGQSKHPKIFVNYTINRKNASEVEDFLKFASTVPQIKGVFFYFHTPYYGIDELFQSRNEKMAIAQQLIQLKKKYNVLNSKVALTDYINNNWQRPSKVCIVYTNYGEIVDCCRAIKNDEACKNCGYLGYLEVIDITKLKPNAIFEATRFLPSQIARTSYVE